VQDTREKVPELADEYSVDCREVRERIDRFYSSRSAI